MASSSSSSSCLVSGNRNQVIGELTRGRDIAARIRLLLRETGSFDPAASASSVLPDLVTKILDSFTQSISVLCAATAVRVDPGKFPDAAPPPSPPPAARRKSDSCKSPEDRRGRHKRKRSAETWVKESPTWPEDEHAWRKYGQKVILNAKHPRNYFRCTHKYDQGCPATKQVQKIQDNPPVFRAIYHAHHSCTSSLPSGCSSSSLSHQIMMHDQDSPIIWSFQQPGKQPCRASPPGDDCYFVYGDDPPAAGTAPAAAFSSGSDRGDVISSSDVHSCTASTRDNMEDHDIMTAGSVLDDFLQL